MVRPIKGLGRKPKNVSLPVEFFEPETGDIAVIETVFRDFSSFVEFATEAVVRAIVESQRTLDHDELRVVLLRKSNEVDELTKRLADDRIKRREPRLQAHAARAEEKRKRLAAIRAQYPTPESIADKHADQPEGKLRYLAEAAGHDVDVVLQLAAEVRERRETAAREARRAHRAANPPKRQRDEDSVDKALAKLREARERREAQEATRQANLLVVPDPDAKPNFGPAVAATAPRVRDDVTVAEVLAAKPTARKEGDP